MAKLNQGGAQRVISQHLVPCGKTSHEGIDQLGASNWAATTSSAYEFGLSVPIASSQESRTNIGSNLPPSDLRGDDRPFLAFGPEGYADPPPPRCALLALVV